MSDLSFAEMSADPLCPANSFTVINNKVYLDIGVFIGESVDELSDRKVSELVIKFGRVGHAAQNTVNIGRTSGTQLNCFNPPSYSPPQANSAGNITARITVTAQGLLGVNVDDVIPLLR